MLKRVFKLFQIARKFSTSGAVEVINEIHVLPSFLNLFFNFISIGSNSRQIDNKKKPGEKLCVALQGMGTTFIKLGQFLATRPDIIGDELAKDLEKLQDKVPAFDLYDAKKIIKKEIGENYFKDLNDISNTYSTIAKSMEYFIHSLEQSKDRIVSSDSIVSKNFVVDLLKNLINIISVELDSNQFFRKSTNFYINSKLMYTTPIINFEINDNFFKFEFIQNNKLEFYIDLKR